MRRILLVLTAAALMVGMVVMAVPAFADPGGEVGHASQSGDVGFVNCDPFQQSCTGTQTFAGPNAVLGGAGRFETTSTFDFTDLRNPVIEVSQDSQGGGPGIGGGNCTATVDPATGVTVEGVGSRC